LKELTKKFSSRTFPFEVVDCWTVCGVHSKARSDWLLESDCLNFCKYWGMNLSWLLCLIIEGSSRLGFDDSCSSSFRTSSTVLFRRLASAFNPSSWSFCRRSVSTC
jgi:hypothetical protein